MTALSFSDIFDDILYRISQGGILFDLLFHLLNGVNDSRIMTVAEFLTDCLHRQGRQLADDVNGDLSGFIDIGAAGFLRP